MSILGALKIHDDNAQVGGGDREKGGGEYQHPHI